MIYLSDVENCSIAVLTMSHMRLLASSWNKDINDLGKLSTVDYCSGRMSPWDPKLSS